ncbi:MAG: hypothetical protein ACQESP_12760 [Candidatus Muiribacteriota bacterium]
MNKITVIFFTIITVFFCRVGFADDSLSLFKEYKDSTDAKIGEPLTRNSFKKDFLKDFDNIKNSDLYKENPYASYDTGLRYKFDFNFYDKNIELIPKFRITKTLEKKILPGEDKTASETQETTSHKNNTSTVSQSKIGTAGSSSKTNSIFVGMDLSYALNKSVYIDSNLSFHQTALEINNQDSREAHENNSYRYEGNAMALSIGLRKQLTDSFSAGLLYSWEKWMNETEDFSIKKDLQNDDKDFDEESQEALNLILRYDF